MAGGPEITLKNIDMRHQIFKTKSPDKHWINIKARIIMAENNTFQTKYMQGQEKYQFFLQNIYIVKEKILFENVEKKYGFI